MRRHFGIKGMDRLVGLGLEWKSVIIGWRVGRMVCWSQKLVCGMRMRMRFWSAVCGVLLTVVVRDGKCLLILIPSAFSFTLVHFNVAPYLE